MKKQAMSSSPTPDLLSCDDSVLPLHITKSPVAVHQYVPGDVSSSDESSSDSAFWSKSDDVGLPMWSASNPQSPTQDYRASSVTTLRQRRKPLFVAGFILVGIAAVFTSQTSLNRAEQHVSALELQRDEIGNRLQKYEKDIRMLEREVGVMDLMIQTQQNLDSQSFLQQQATNQRQRALQEMNELQQRLRKEAMQAKALKAQVQAMSRDDIIEKYGYGEHRVEIELVFPDHHRGPTKFIIQLAPAEMMPHSVHTFLEMVSSGLLDGCSFILNALHVLKAAPLPYDGTSAAEKAKAFSERGLESVAFKEYNEAYPHKQYTVGFAADGSPSFYVNTEDNSEIHVGDPCFGKVIEGFDTVHRLEAMPTRNGIWFERRIGIKHARILLND